MRLSLYSRIALGYMLSIAIVLAAQGLAFMWLVQRSNEPTPPDLTQRLAAELSQALAATPDLDLEGRVARLQPGKHVFAIMKDGRVAGRRTPPESIVRDVFEQFRISREDEIPATWRGGAYRAAGLTIGGRTVGVLGIVPPTPTEGYGAQIAAVALVLLIAGTLVSAVLIVGPVRARLHELSTAAEQLGSGDLSARARVRGRDEVAELGASFNAMADELERRASALSASDRARRQLIADVSHELMTPLTAILGHLETLSMAEVRLDDDKRLRQLAVTTREAKRLERLVGDLLDTARLEAGGGQLELEPIATADLFDQVMAHHEHDCRTRNLQFTHAIEAGAETLRADAFRLEQALLNVTANAIRHTGDGGVIRLGAERAGCMIVLTVTDSGEGIAPEHLPYIFDRFYKTASIRGIASRGSGLGLSIVKAVVTRHEGRVSATSTVGVGTTIRIELPATPAEGQGAAPAA